MIRTAEENRGILVITTGGTIDSKAYPNPDDPPEFATPLKTSAVPQTLETLGYMPDHANGQQHIRIMPWGKSDDSKEFTPEDLLALAEFIQQQPEKHVIITHGTDWMAPNARIFRNQLHAIGATEKTVAFTGAMIPLANGKKSDGPANLKFAIENIGAWEPGVYLAMHGKRLLAQYAEKDMKSKTFWMPL